MFYSDIIIIINYIILPVFVLFSKLTCLMLIIVIIGLFGKQLGYMADVHARMMIHNFHMPFVFRLTSWYDLVLITNGGYFGAVVMKKIL
jgi:hypothetical protein